MGASDPDRIDEHLGLFFYPGISQDVSGLDLCFRIHSGVVQRQARVTGNTPHCLVVVPLLSAGQESLTSITETWCTPSQRVPYLVNYSRTLLDGV
jgi:hypothetical protein